MLTQGALYRVFHFILERQAPTRSFSEFLLYFLTVSITAICFLAHFINCQTSPTSGVGGNAGGDLGWRLSVKQEKEHSIYLNVSHSCCVYNEIKIEVLKSKHSFTI